MFLERFDSDTDPEILNTIRNDPRVWVRNALNHPIRTGDMYDFMDAKKETRFDYMIHEDGPMNPENWGDINIFLMCRGGLKSTMTRFIFSWAHDCYPELDSYFVAPTKGQVLNWTEKFRKNVEESGLAARYYSDNKTHQHFRIERERPDGTKYPVDGHLKTDSGYSEESVRGPHSQMGLIDEMQDLEKGVFDAYYPCIDAHHPHLDWCPVIFGIGTPKETGTFFHELWELSDQKTWDADEQAWVQQSEPETYEIGVDEAEELGIDLDETEAASVRAWHLDWMNSPKHDDSQILQAKASMGTMEFINEVKAEFYDPEDNLLTVSGVKEMFDPNDSFYNGRMAENSTVVLGVDWGGGKDKNAADTVLAVVEQMESADADGLRDMDSTLLNIEFLDDSLTKVEQIQKVEEWILQYEVDRAVIDYGFGSQAMESLQDGYDTMDPDGYMDTVKAVRFGNVKNKGELKWEQSSGDERFATADKERNSSQMVDWIRDGRLTIPTATMDEQGSNSTKIKLINHLTAPYKTLKTTPSGSKKVRIETAGNKNDDAFDALTYAWIGLHEMDGRQLYTGFASSARAGY